MVTHLRYVCSAHRHVNHPRLQHLDTAADLQLVSSLFEMSLLLTLNQRVSLPSAVYFATPLTVFVLVSFLPHGVMHVFTHCG